MEFALAYDHRTAISNDFNSSALDFATNLRRAPVAFQGRVRDPLLMREMMLALHETILGEFRSDIVSALLDPVVTVHPDELFFEAFSADQSAYVRLSISPDAFEIDGDVQYGTTNIDFTAEMRSAVRQMRSSRDTSLSIGAGGVGMQTTDEASAASHFEHKVDVPADWIRGFLQVQSALAARPYTFDMRPIDLISTINHFMDTSAPKPPRAMRFEFRPGQAICIVLEPWEHRYWLKDTQYTGYERVVRTWGRKRLSLLIRVLPFAEKVTVGVLGRGLPHFYICRCGHYTFTLVLSGWVRNDWAASSTLDLLAPQADLDAEQMATVYNFLIQRMNVTHQEAENHTLLSAAQVEAALFALCREGHAMYDPTIRRYRSRELFAKTPDFEQAIAPDPRLDLARQMVATGRVTVDQVGPSEKRKSEIRIQGRVDDYAVTVSVDQEARVRFAQCTCPFFREHVMAQGPCEHILAVRFAANEHLSEFERSGIIST